MEENKQIAKPGQVIRDSKDREGVVYMADDVYAKFAEQDGERWCALHGEYTILGWAAEREGLVVIDPEDKRECAWLADASRDACAEDIDWVDADAVQRALRSIRDERAEEFEPKQPAEPTEIGTKVELKDGGVAYRMHDGADSVAPWFRPSGRPVWQDWRYLCGIGIARILTPNYKEESSK